MTSLVRSLCTSTVLVLSLVACKQGAGERCEIESDCESGLTCTTQHICEDDQAVRIDAGAVPDARPDGDIVDVDAAPDAQVFDAGPDAQVFDAGPADAAIDATPP